MNNFSNFWRGGERDKSGKARCILSCVVENFRGLKIMIALLCGITFLLWFCVSLTCKTSVLQILKATNFGWVNSQMTMFTEVSRKTLLC
jgi:hypothetical protein